MTPHHLSALIVSACAAGLALSACAEAETETAVQGPVEEAVAAQPAPEVQPGADIIAAAPNSDWRTVPAENLLHMVTSKGEVWIELAPEFTPNHIARIREMADADWMDWKVFHRVIDGFMAQGGGAMDNPSVRAPFAPLQAEFTLRRDPNTVVVSELQERASFPRGPRAQAGFYNGMPAGTQPAALAGIMADGRVDSWLMHCEGAAAMARTSDPNSANAQFYIVNGEAEHLNTQYTVWGKVRVGMDVVHALNEGVMGQSLGFRPDVIEEFELATQKPEADRPVVQVLDTNSASFTAYLQALAASRETGRLPDICEIDVPVRVLN